MKHPRKIFVGNIYLHEGEYYLALSIDYLGTYWSDCDNEKFEELNGSFLCLNTFTIFVWEEFVDKFFYKV